jgi:hypothetical protein
MNMRMSKVLSLFVVMVCTFCIAGAGLAGEIKNPITGADRNSIGTQSSIFRPINLADSHGDLTLITGWTADAGQVDAVASKRVGQLDLQPDVLKVLTVLERRIGDRRLIEEARYKLAGMSEKRLRLAVSLSERVADHGSPAETHIAFLLLTTLIVFS